MDGLLSPRFWIQTIAATLITMVLIYLIKKGADRFNVPVIKTIADGV